MVDSIGEVELETAEGFPEIVELFAWVAARGTPEVNTVIVDAGDAGLLPDTTRK